MNSLEKPPVIEHVSFECSISKLSWMIKWAEEKARLTKFAKKDVRKIELALEEILVNVISHSGLTEKDQIDLMVHCYIGRRIEFIVLDQGTPFDPTQHQIKLDRNAPIEEREIGGLGLFFTRNAVDTISYERKGNFNILTLIKILNE